jgi:hypothetical protein
MPKPEIDSLSLPPPIRELVRTAIAWNTILRNPKIARATVVQAQKDLEAAVAALPPIR